MLRFWDFCVFIILFSREISTAEGACVFPFNASSSGEIWFSAEKGELTVTDTTINGYYVGGNINFNMEFNCEENQGDMYLLRATQIQNIFGDITRFYLCMDIFKLDDVTFYYYIGTETDPFINDAIHPKKNDLATLEEACNKLRPLDEESFIMMVKQGSFEAGHINTTCPSDLLARFDNVTVSGTNGVSMTTTGSCQGSYLDVCEDRTVLKFHSECSGAPKSLSVDGLYSCLHYVTVAGTTYLAVWNQDSTVDNTANFQFSCFAFRKVGGVVFATESPRFCSNTTTSTSVTTGIIFLFTSISETCLDETAVPAIAVAQIDLRYLYIPLALFLLFLLIFLIILIICLCKKYCKKRKTKEQPPMTKKKPLPTVDNFRPKRPINIAIFNLALGSGFSPNIKPMQKISPLYTDSVVDYIHFTPPRTRAVSSNSTKSFDSVIFRQREISETLSRSTLSSKSSSSITSTEVSETSEVETDSETSSRASSTES